jgi:hypothetical protein
MTSKAKQEPTVENMTADKVPGIYAEKDVGQIPLGIKEQMSRNARQYAALEKMREPFPDNLVSYKPQRTCKAEEYDKLPKGTCNICGGYHATSKTAHLSYVGHAALTKRLLDADQLWDWEPLSFDTNGEPHFDASGGLWIKLTVAGITRLGYGHNEVMKYSEIGSRTKAVIGDALRNAAMRFGAALEEWHKGDLGLPDPAIVDGFGWGGLEPESTEKPAVVMPQSMPAANVLSEVVQSGIPATAEKVESVSLAEVGEVNFITKKLCALKNTDSDKLLLDTIGINTLENLTKANFEKLKIAVKGKK